MKRLLVASILLLGANDLHAETCKSFRIRPQDWSAMMTAARNSTGRQVDTRTIHVCRISVGIFAAMDTVRERQSDNSELWENVDCFRRRDEAQWSCSVFTKRALRLEPVAGIPDKEVELPLSMKAQDVQPLVAMVYESLPTMTGSNLCKDNWADPTAVDAMRHAFLARDSGILFLYRGGTSTLFLARDDHFIAFAPDPGRSPGLRVDCWGRVEPMEE